MIEIPKWCVEWAPAAGIALLTVGYLIGYWRGGESVMRMLKRSTRGR